MQPGVPHSHQLPAVVRPANATVAYGAWLVRSLGEGENRSGRAKMQAAANTSLFLMGYSSKAGLADSEIVFSDRGLIQHIFASHFARTVHSYGSFVRLADALIQLAEQSYMLRDVNALQELSSALMNVPINGARQIGLYYYALAINRNGHRDEAEALLEALADKAPFTYRGRAIQTLGGNLHDKCRFDEAARFQLDALRLASDQGPNGLQTAVLAQLEISHLKSNTGDHKGALTVLERTSPLVRVVAQQNPLFYYLYHNELAVELAELGRLAEAEAAITIALAAPFAPAYPEWSETRDEIAAKRSVRTPSAIAINRAVIVEPSPKIQSQSQRRQSPILGANSRTNGGTSSFQRPISPIPATVITSVSAISIRDRVLICVGPRSPPARR